MKYQAANHVLMRCPTRSLDEFYDFAKLPDNEIMDFSRQDEIFAEAVAIASQDLYKMYADGSIKTTDRMIESVKKYYDRMTARPTPYGLFAGVTTVEFSDEGTNICLAEQEKYRKICRVDNEWYFKLVKKIEEMPGLLMNLRVIFNKHCYTAGSRLKNCYCSNLRKENINHAEDLSISNTKQVQYVQEFASDFVSFKDLRDFLINKNPNVPQEIIDKFLKELLVNEYIYTNVCVLWREEDPLRGLLQNNQFLDISKEEQDFIDKLIEIDTLREEYANVPFGQGREILDKLSGLMEQVVKAKNYIYTILQLSTENNKLDKKIKENLENFSQFMQDIATPDNEGEYLLVFKEAFREKYGSDALVSLTEAIDADKGLGLPYNGYLTEAAVKFAKKNSKKLEAIKRMLERKMLTALRQGQSAIELTDKDIASIKDIEADKLSELGYVSSYSLNILVTKKDTDYEIHIGPNIGSTQAGNGISRFDSALNADFSHEMDEIYAKEKALHSEDYVIADVYEVSHYLRNTNLYSYKRQYDYNLYLGITEFEHNSSLNLNDLYLGYDGQKDRLFVWSKLLHKRVKFMTNSMYNTQSSNPIIRFLRNVSFGYEIQAIDNMYVFQSLNYMYWPKIKYGNIVLANEKWRLNPEQFSDSKSLEQFIAELQEYLKIWQLPRYVYYTNADNRLVLDLTDEFAQRLLYRALIKQKQEAVLERMEYEDISSSLVSDKKNQCDAVEFSVPMFSSELAQQQPVNKIAQVPAYNKSNLIENFYTQDRVLYTGDEGWLYFKIYLNQIQANTFLANYLEAFLTDLFNQKIIKSFFFIKYADPKYHIRLRLQISEPDKLGVAMRRFREWFNLLQDNLISYEYTIAQYEREIERYGGQLLMPYAEEYFCQDSRLVMALLQEINKDAEEIEREKVGIFAIYNLVDCFCGGIQADSDFLVKYTDNIEHKSLFRKNKNVYLSVIENDYATQFSAKTQKIIADRTAVIKQYAEKIKQSEAKQQLANSVDNILLTLIHMFCNRYNGNREWERKVLFLTRHTVFTENNMLLHGADRQKKGARTNDVN